MQVFEPVNSSELGQEISVKLENAGQANAAVTLRLSEKPIFLFVNIRPAAAVNERFHPTDFNMRTFPNPFNSAFTLVYDLPQAADVVISIYDLGGRLVKQLQMRKEFGRNYEQISLNGEAGSGVYWVKLTAGDVSARQKIYHIQ
ncbi:MAG: T9SS type A sorting domain-containing protein [candidate division KSB1 bacterium]|nr:T9SS type A sorting domain-containing protein [candidate division KSB1 bacterium]MDZ7345784.1 T9SS type A sorting domain-containing protein [candidate division KSB1 bacterium]